MEAFRCVLSYVWVRIRPPKDQNTLEGWIVARFGWRLYTHFFKTYNEKLWGPTVKSPGRFRRPTHQEPVVVQCLRQPPLARRNRKDITSLIEEFQYPKLGPGMMWERCRDLVEHPAARWS